MNLNLRRKKLLRILNHIAKQEKIIKFLNTPEYHQFAEVVDNRERFINTYASEDTDDLIEFFEKLIKTFEKKDIKKKDIKKLEKVKEKIKAELIKVSIPSLEQKFPITKYNQLSVFDEIKDRKLVKEAKDLNIKIIGWDLTKAEEQAVFAIQKIYAKYGYRGNINNNSNALKFTPAEFYESFGVLKYINNLGKEDFSRAEENHAYKSLINLSTIQCLMAYTIRDPETKEFNRVEILSAIIPEIHFLYTDPDKKVLDNEKKKKEKLKYFKIIPSRVLLDQIENNYYALLRSDLYTEIKEKLPGVTNKHLPLFIKWLSKENALRRRKNLNNIIEISFEKLAQIFRMDNWIKAGRQKLINDRIVECFKWAKTLGYLNWYKTGTGKTVTKKATLSINIYKFRPSKRIIGIVDDDHREEEPIKEVKKVEDSEIVKRQKARIHIALGLPKR
jgi:hypothetical protein